MRSLEEIDESISDLISFLSENQKKNGSFDMYYLQPHYHPEKSWMNYPAPVVYNTAQALLPILKIKSESVKSIVRRAEPYLVQVSLGKKLWTFAPISKDYIIPYDTDSTSLASLVLSSLGHKIENKEFLDSIINDHNHYPFYIRNSGNRLPLTVRLKLNWHNHKMKRSRTLLNDDMRFSDFEFASSCINLLYLGKSEANEKVWNQLNQEINEFKIEQLYYIDLIRSFYLCSRTMFNWEGAEITLKKTVQDEYFGRLHKALNDSTDSFSRLLVVNSMLFLNREMDNFNQLIEDCFSSIDKGEFKLPNAFFSSNKRTDCQPGTEQPNTYFGSPAITCSLYIEFLMMYCKRVFGSYYGE